MSALNKKKKERFIKKLISSMFDNSENEKNSLNLRNEEKVDKINTKEVDLKIWVKAENLFDQHEIKYYKKIGLVMLTIVGILYYFAPVLMIFWPLLLIIKAFSWKNFMIYSIIMIILCLVPPKIYKSEVKNKLFASVPLYFDTSIYGLTTPEKLRNHNKPILYLIIPHGVISLGGWCASIGIPRTASLAVAEILFYLPFLKHIFAVFNICSSSKKSLTKQLKVNKKDVCLYPGGIAEMFLSHPEREICYFKKRKGCMKLAMKSGADVCIVYTFGTTQLYRIFFVDFIKTLSRFFRFSITFFWGRYGTVIPKKTSMVCVFSDIIPLCDFSESNNEKGNIETKLEQDHAKVIYALGQLFDKAKHLHPQYKDKNIIII